MKKTPLQFFLVIMSVLLSKNATSQCGTTNRALNKFFAASSAAEYHSGPSGVDGSTNNGSSWISSFVANQNDTQTYVIDMGASYTVCQVHITWEDPAMNYTIQVAPDTSNWTTIKTVTNNTDTGNIWTSLSGVGQYLRVRMTKKSGTWNNYAMYELRVYDQNVSPPTVTLTSPANGTQFNSGTQITVSANAQFTDHVEFFYEANGTTTEIGSDDFTEPYSTTWTPTQPGVYKIKAIATNAYNTSVTSNIDTITVIATTSGAWLLMGNSGVADSNYLGTSGNQNLVFKTNSLTRMTILNSGKVRIGTQGQGDSTALLSVNGTVFAKKLKITQQGWADYVFDKGYELLSIEEIEKFIKTNKHLPGVLPASKVINSDIDIGETQEMLLRKIEELTLYIIEQNKLLKSQEERLNRLEKSVGTKLK